MTSSIIKAIKRDVALSVNYTFCYSGNHTSSNVKTCFQLDFVLDHFTKGLKLILFEGPHHHGKCNLNRPQFRQIIRNNLLPFNNITQWTVHLGLDKCVLFELIHLNLMHSPAW